MKQKKMPKQRNVFAVLACKRNAGSHTKSHKSKRGKLNRDGWDGLSKEGWDD